MTFLWPYRGYWSNRTGSSFPLWEWSTEQHYPIYIFHVFIYHFQKCLDYLKRYTENGSLWKTFLFFFLLDTHRYYSYLDENWYTLFAFFMKFSGPNQAYWTFYVMQPENRFYLIICVELFSVLILKNSYRYRY